MFCKHCGQEINDNAVICVNCGCATDVMANDNQTTDSTILKTIIKVFMILGCIASASFFLIPLCWTIPMTIKYFNATKNKQPLSVAFKVCSLLFVNLIAGVLMLCDNNN